jgi:hypothetical protein
MVFLNPPFGRSYMKPDRSSVIGAGEFQKLSTQDAIMDWALAHDQMPEAKSSNKKEQKLGKALKGFLDPDHEDYDATFALSVRGDLYAPQAPLYSVHTDIADWTERCVFHHRQFGTEIISLLPAATDTKGHWQKLIFPTATKICFIAGRICFLDENGEPGGPCPMAMALVYWGPHGSKFQQAAEKYGSVR